MVKRLIALGLACGGLGAVRAFAPLSSCLARSPESSLKVRVCAENPDCLEKVRALISRPTGRSLAWKTEALLLIFDCEL